MAMTMAPASTASPASWPPIRRGSSGSVADAGTAFTRCGRVPADGLTGVGVPVPGVTVGKRFAGLVAPTPGNVPVPGSVGTGSTGIDGIEAVGVGVGELFAVAEIRIDADAWNEVALFPVAVAVSLTFFPAAAARPTSTVACSSSACPVGRSPTVQTAPFATGQTLNFAAFTCARRATAAVTFTSLAAAAVVQTQIA